MINSKKSNIGFSSIALMIIALIGGLAIIAIIAYLLGAFSDPDKINEGIKCRLTIQASATLQEATQGLTPEKIIDACHTLQTTIPRRESYPAIGKSLNSMKPDQLRQVVMFDFAELINNAWWITGEGDRADYLLNKFKGIFVSTNDCYVVYAVRIHTPQEFTTFSYNDLKFELDRLTRADIKGSSSSGDTRTIDEYITLDGKGAGMFLTTDDSKIEYKEKGADPLYGIAVGFAKKSGIAELAITLFGKGQTKIREGASFIYIAPYEEIGSLCRVI
jgi:hypothetical protein